MHQFLISMFKMVSPKVYVYFLFDKITLAVFSAFLGRLAATFCKLLGFSNLRKILLLTLIPLVLTWECWEWLHWLPPIVNSTAVN